MTVARVPFPADLNLRRQLWRQWVHLDVPQGELKARQMASARVAVAHENGSADRWVRSTIDATPGVVDGLKSAIAAAVDDGQLSNADRARFISRGVRLGLSRFDANLLVAAVQHSEAERAGVRVIRRWKRPKRTRSIASTVATCVALEAAAVVAIACWLRA